MILAPPPTMARVTTVEATPDRRGRPGRALLGWAGPLGVMAIGGWIRFSALGRPDAVIFDETYYAKDGLSLTLFGYERKAVEGADELLLQGRTDIFTDSPGYVIHPPLGKWVAGSGQWLFEVSPAAWRFGSAVLGTLAILLLARIVRRMTGSTLLGCIAGLLLALEGLSIVLSRTAMLDGPLAFFVLAAFGCLVIDRDHRRAGTGPRWRPWRVAAGVCLGLACGTKWSGVFYLAAFGLMTVLWDRGARQQAGEPSPTRAALRRDALPAFLAIVPTAIVTYVVTWSGWLLTSGGWDRQWAANNNPSGNAVVDAFRSLWHYHGGMLSSARDITSDHPYESEPIGWLVLVRPVSMHYDGEATGCGADRCVSEVLALGNPAIWWAGLAALAACLWWWGAQRDWRAGAALLGVAAGWLPWALSGDRTVFSWYVVVAAPFVCLAITLAIARILGPNEPGPRRMWAAIAVGAYLLVVLAMFAWFEPIWTGEVIPYDAWRARMWFSSWI